MAGVENLFTVRSSAVIRATSEKTRGGGGLSAMNLNFRWSMIRLDDGTEITVGPLKAR
jgi:hypothetical protein